MDPVQDARWLAAKNNDAGEMPAFAVAVVASSGTEGQFVLTKPTANGEHAWIAGAVPALAGDGAEVTNDFPAWALYDDGDGTPAVGETWGAGASSWKLRKNNAGFRICGTPDTTLKIVPVERAASSGGGATVITNSSGSDYTSTGWTAGITPIASDANRLYIASFFIAAPSVAPLSLYMGIAQWDDAYSDPNDDTFITLAPGTSYSGVTFDGNGGPHLVIGYLPATAGKHVAPVWKVAAGTASSIYLIHFSHLPAEL